MLIAFSGKASAGKTTAANHIVSLFGGVKLSLSDALKTEVLEFLVSMGADFEMRNLYGTQKDKDEYLVLDVAQWTSGDYRARRVLNGYVKWVGPTKVAITFRLLLQAWGSEYRRSQSQSYWTDKTLEVIRGHKGMVLIDDVRFPDEAEMVANEGGILIRIERPDRPIIGSPDHQSETALDDYKGFTMTVINGGSLEDFESEIEKVVRLMV